MLDKQLSALKRRGRTTPMKMKKSPFRKEKIFRTPSAFLW